MSPRSSRASLVRSTSPNAAGRHAKWHRETANAELLGIAIAACAVCTIDGMVVRALHDVARSVDDVTARFVA